MKAAVMPDWHVWSRHGDVVVLLALRPGSTIKEIAESLYLTERTIRDTVADLRRAGMLKIRRNGRRLHYHVNLDAPFRHPTIKGVTLRTLLGGINGDNGSHETQRERSVASHLWSAASPATS